MFRNISVNKLRIASACTRRHLNGDRQIALRVNRRALANVAPQSTQAAINSYDVGDKIVGYNVTDVQEIPELAMTAVSLKHEKTGAEHLHLARDDPNNCFSVTLRTTPEDSSGVAHILEHLALCGSKKYPTRDPFMKMTNRSLATFMNAMTWPDATMYPFSSTNKKDFQNLLGVYLDAVFFPQLNYYDFRQEGWRLEHEDVNDKNSPIVIKGVVYNEMKGAFSSSSALYSRFLLNKIFPSTTYSNESGGDPKNIPDLTYEYLKNFYAKHYHPSNARFYTYGNFPLEATLSMIDDLVLNKFEKDEEVRKLSEVPLQPKWSEPLTAHLHCAPDPFAPFPEKQTTVSVSFLLDDIGNTFECFTLGILSHLMTAGPNSPFYQALVASGLGMDYSPDTGVNEYTRQYTFSVGLQGIAETEVETVKKLVDETLARASVEGFSSDRLEAVIHLIELSTKHQSQNFGLRLLYGINPRQTHDVNVVDSLQVNKNISQLRESLAKDPNFLKDKIKKHFIENKHRLTLTMTPSENYLTESQNSEKERLQEKVSKLSDADKEKVYKEGIELAERQKRHDDGSVLPIIDVNNDIPRTKPRTELEHVELNGVKVQLSAQKTNEICYFRSLFTLDTVPDHLKPYLPLFVEVLTKLGAAKRNHLAMDQEIQLRTKGLHASVHIAEDPFDFNKYERGLQFWSCSLEKNLDHMLNLWSDLFTDVRISDDSAYLQQLVKIASSEFVESIPQSGHRFAMKRAASSITEAANFRESTDGLALAHTLKGLAENTDNVADVIAKLEEIKNIVFTRDNLRCSFNAEPRFIRGGLSSVESFVSTLPKTGKNSSSVNDSQTTLSKSAVVREHHVLPFSANYVGKALPTVPFSHNDFAPLKLASSLMSSKYLLREVREIGGAYGGGAGLTDGGIFVYFSYRDPNSLQTLKKFDDSANWLASGNFDEQFVDEAKISTFQDVDKPVTPENKGLGEFVARRTHELKEKHRKNLLTAKKEDLVRVAKKYLLEPQKVGIAIIGPENEEIKSDKQWQRITSE